ncbi:E3 ubiquitin-protein ligase TRIM47-like [Polypterus senegalus]|uniref:E3 ubiquitin-protein ligase TRIM47-like n=1 Tax=Polypterus senegalus TaxID=55291 RepID=UPI0019643331|nr:E3 ubiquitin-protein ligase TRIM47-like [Polypterus senegalus]
MSSNSSAKVLVFILQSCEHLNISTMIAEDLVFVSQDEFICSVCLDPLTDPITIPCGHSFCLQCLGDYWDQRQECRCPQCATTFTTRPELHINTVLNEVVKKIKKPLLSPLVSPNYTDPEYVECDACTGRKSRAAKSCLTCKISYCHPHLQPHFEIEAWKDHKLTNPDANLKEKICSKHHQSLDMFCKTDDMCICMICVVNEHNGHTMVELEPETEEKQKQLGETLREIRRRVQKSKKKQNKMRRAVEQLRISMENEVDEHEKSLTDLICCIEETRRKLMERFRERERMEMEKVQEVMEKLDEEIEELEWKDAELRELMETKDQICFLQNFSSRCVLPAEGDTFSFDVSVNFSSEDLRKELSCMKKSLEKISQWGIMTLTSDFCPLTLDINTANRHLHLSEGNKKVTRKETKIKYPDHPDRFEWCPQVLCREALTGTRCYWEVECSGCCMRIGVAYEGLGRNECYWPCGLGENEES